MASWSVVHAMHIWRLAQSRGKATWAMQQARWTPLRVSAMLCRLLKDLTSVTSLDFDYMRNAMVDRQLRTVGVNDPAVVAALRAVPREAFVPQSLQALAYVDEDIELLAGRYLSQPMVTGRLLTYAELVAGEKVLVVGAGTGYAAVLLDKLKAQVVALEEEPALAAQMRQALAKVGAKNVTVVEGALAQGCAAHAPYDLLFCDMAVEELPHGLLLQMAEGARVVAPVINSAGICQLSVGRVSAGRVAYLHMADQSVPALAAFARPPVFQF